LAVPHFQRLQKEGESGRKKINQYTRWLTVVVTLLQAPGYIKTQIPANAIMDPGVMFWVTSLFLLVAGTMFIMWLGERITDKGIGNGISLIIMIGIIANLPVSFVQEFVSRLENQGGGLVILLVELVFLFLIIVISILLVQGTRKIPVQFAKKIVGNRQYGGVRQYIPLKVNASGVMPIIFAQAIMFIPLTVAGFSDSGSVNGFVSVISDYTGFWHNFAFASLIIIFTYFYTAITINPNQMADDMKRNGGFIPGVKPGKKTAEFIDSVMSRITFPGSLFLAFVAILPAFATKLGVNSQFALFYGGTSLLILVGVVLDTLQQIESHLLMRHYDGLMKSGRIKGRTSPSAVSMVTN
jgi:preprotein translocase subunit SecY